LEEVGIESLHQRLAQVDPLTAHRLHPNDKRRVIRALEVYKITGQPISHQQDHFDDGLPADQCKVFVLGWPRDVLHARIEQRVEQMFDSGLVDEVEQLLQEYQTLSRTAFQAVGYREVIEMLQSGGQLSEATERVTIRTRQFARRQETWFRSLSECRRIEQMGVTDPTETVDAMIALAESGNSEEAS